MSQEQNIKSPTWKVLGILFLLIGLPVLWVMVNKTGQHYAKKLPYFFERELGPNGDTIYHTIEDFKLVNQFGDTVTLETYKGKILLVSFFFASCETVCPAMNGYINTHIYNEYRKDTNVVFLSFTVDPANDSPSVLKHYADNLGVGRNWQFLTGPKQIIYDLALESFKIPGAADAKHQNLFHSSQIVLVDKERHVRGVFETGGQNEKSNTNDAVKALQYEYKQIDTHSKK